VFTIGSGATMNVSKTEGMTNGGGATPTFAVNGTFLVSSPSTIAVQPIDSGINFTNSGTIDIHTTAIPFMTLSGLANTGRVRVEAGNAWAGSITSSGAAAVVTGAGMYRQLGSPFPSGALTLNGGRLAPGDPVGTMQVALPITMGPGSVFEAELGGPVPAQYDQLNLTNGGSISFNGSALNVLLEYAPSPTDVFTIVFGGPVNGTFAGLANGTEFSVGRFNGTDYDGTITYTPTSIVLSNIHAIPEPAAWLLAGAAAAAWTWRRRGRMTRSKGQ
jgi:fibronectin-binding autotransporter adhesin